MTTILPLSTAKLWHTAAAATNGKVVASPIPGCAIGDRVVRRPYFIYGNNLVVSRSSENKALAFLFAMWFTDAEVSTRTLLETSGFQDPFRYQHLESPDILALYRKDAIDALRTSIPLAVPGGIGLPGSKDYFAVLSQSLDLAVQGKITPHQAMEQTAARWEEITERMGRAEQIRYWRQFRTKYPPNTMNGTMTGNMTGIDAKTAQEAQTGSGQPASD